MAVSSRELHRSWVEIDLQALRENLMIAQQRAGAGAALMAVVKADAYGHGLEQIAETIADRVAFFGVACVAEARALEGVLSFPRPAILLLGASLPHEMRQAIAHGWHLSISTTEELAEANSFAEDLGTVAHVHLVVDSGMGRMGCLEVDFPDLCHAVQEASVTQWCGVASHLPVADEDWQFTQKQLESLRRLFNQINQEKAGEFWEHDRNSAGLLRFAAEPRCLVRVGLLMYGLSPEQEFQGGLKPVMALKSRVCLLRDLPPGRSISYGRTFITQRTTRVATIGIGYGDGYPRSLSGKGADVLIRGVRCPLLGRVTMDQIMVDVTDHPEEVNTGDEVVLFGTQRGETIDAREIAERAGTIPWEIFTGITKRVARVYSGAGALSEKALVNSSVVY